MCLTKERDVKVSLCEGLALPIRENGNQERRAVLYGVGRKRTVACRGQSYTDSDSSFVMSLSNDNNTFI